MRTQWGIRKKRSIEKRSELFTLNFHVYFVAFQFSVPVFERVIDNKTVFTQGAGVFTSNYPISLIYAT